MQNAELVFEELRKACEHLKNAEREANKTQALHVHIVHAHRAATRAAEDAVLQTKDAQTNAVLLEQSRLPPGT